MSASFTAEQGLETTIVYLRSFSESGFNFLPKNELRIHNGIFYSSKIRELVAPILLNGSLKRWA